MEQVPNSFPHLLLGYSIIFGILSAYIFVLARKTRGIEKKIEEFESKAGNP